MRLQKLCFGVGWLVFAFSALAQTAGLDQKVSVNKTSSTIQEVLTELSSNYKLNFSYSNDLVPLQQKVSIKANKWPLREVLNVVLVSKGIRYAVIGSQIILQPERTKKKQVQLTISGYVTDAHSGEALAGATITAGATGTSANTYGFFSLQVPPGPVQMQARYLGYGSLQVQLPAVRQDTTVKLQLAARSQALGEVGVIAERITDLPSVSRLSIRSQEIKQLPRLIGEADAMKAIQLMPGVQAGREASSDLIVRGGSPDQNLVLLDGVPVYNVSHLLGTFSVFNPDAIKNVELIKGGFPAPYGGRLSSVVDVQLKEGNSRHFAGEGAVGLISSKLLLEGPIKNEKTSFLVAARRTYLDIITMGLAALSGKPISRYNFSDVNAKINHAFSATDRIYLSVYSGHDQFSDIQEYTSLMLTEEQRFKMRWGNTTGALRWNHVFGPRLFSNVTLLHSRYGFSQGTGQKQTQDSILTERNVDYGSSIKDWGMKVDFDFAARPKHHVRFGGSYTYHNFKPEAVTIQADSIKLTSNNAAIIPAHEFYSYAEDNIQLSERLQARTGLHFSGFSVQGTTFTSLQPRLALNYAGPKNISVRASYATMAQYLHLLSSPSTGTPTDIWVPATNKVKPQRSWQATLGAAALLKQNQLELTADLYYKKMRDVAEFKDGADFVNDFLSNGPETNFVNFVTTPYETRITSGKGWSYGTEWLLRKRQGRTTGWVGYTLAWSWRQLDSINFNQPYPYTYDSRHSFSLALNHQLTDKWSMGGSWVYRTGFVTTLPSATYKAYNEPIYRPGGSSPYVQTVDYVGERNNYRMPSYHRLDLSLTHTKKKKWGERSWNVSVYNAYNRKNPYSLYLSNSNPGAGSSPRQLYQLSLFPVLPSFSYGFKF